MLFDKLALRTIWKDAAALTLPTGTFNTLGGAADFIKFNPTVLTALFATIGADQSTDTAKMEHLKDDEAEAVETELDIENYDLPLRGT